jgi:hypothetical protein
VRIVTSSTITEPVFTTCVLFLGANDRSSSALDDGRRNFLHLRGEQVDEKAGGTRRRFYHDECMQRRKGGWSAADDKEDVPWDDVNLYPSICLVSVAEVAAAHCSRSAGYDNAHDSFTSSTHRHHHHHSGSKKPLHICRKVNDALSDRTNDTNAMSCISVEDTMLLAACIELG